MGGGGGGGRGRGVCMPAYLNVIIGTNCKYISEVWIHWGKVNNKLKLLCMYMYFKVSAVDQVENFDPSVVILTAVTTMQAWCNHPF